MKTAAIVLLALSLAWSSANSQDKPEPATLSLSYLGVPAEVALTEFARSARLKLDLGDVPPEMETPVWLSVQKVELAHAAKLLSVATGLSVVADGKRLVVREVPEAGNHQFTRGYDVSVLAGRFVDYVRAYGHPDAERAKASPGSKEEPYLATGAESLAHLICLVLDVLWDAQPACSVVGERILLTTDHWTHTRVRELLALLVSDAGGEHPYTTSGRAQLAKLATGEVKYEAEDRPLGSVVAGLCKLASVDFVVHHAIATMFADEHATLRGTDTCAGLLEAVVRHGGYEFTTSTALGVICFRHVDTPEHGGCSVLETATLLKRIDASYQRQKTTPGGPESLRAAGGVQVVVEATETALDAQDCPAIVSAFGTRVIVIGVPSACDAAAGILKEMGWEAPKE